jgi:hypothetical protein
MQLLDSCANDPGCSSTGINPRLARQCRVLIIGGGQVGLAAASALARAADCRFNLHCRTEAGLRRAAADAETAGLLVDSYSHGDLTVVPVPAFTGLVMPHRSTGSPDGPAVAQLVSEARPDIVVDATSMATVLAGWTNHQDALRSLTEYTVDLVEAAVAAGAPVVKVSTTALGGMGLDIPFSHGDLPGEKLPPRMWAKLMLSGAQLQLLWTLARTFPAHGIHALIPATCIGFSPGMSIRTVPDAVVEQNAGRRTARSDTRRQVTAVTAYAGEGPTYTRTELSLLASPSAMGAVTSEEVGEAIVAVLKGETRYDALRALQNSALGPSSRGNRALWETCSRLAQQEAQIGADAFVTGNLGGHVTKLILELAAMTRSIGPDWFNSMLSVHHDDLASRIAGALPGDRPLIAQILAQGMQLIDAGGAWSVDATQAARGTVDLCPQAIANWQDIIGSAIDMKILKCESGQDWQDVLAHLLSDSRSRNLLRTRACGEHDCIASKEDDHRP